jgi:cyclin-dependent kinase regulatory subunit CKS1
MGVQQSIGWVHYAHHKPEPHIMLFRRKLEDSPAPPEGALEMLRKRNEAAGEAGENVKN